MASGQRPLSGTASSDNDDQENKLDFELLMRQLVAAKGSAPRPPTGAPGSLSSTLSSSSSAERARESWPLRLSAQFVDHYILGETVGQGSYAQVRECIDTRTLERCAIKIINKAYLRRQSKRALWNQLQEIKLLQRLRHPNIIRARECIVKRTRIYLVLEYCTFVLSELLAAPEAPSAAAAGLREQHGNATRPASARLCLPVARNFFNQIMLAVEYCHSQGVIHRDIKPQNLLVTTSGLVKLIDFGVSQALSLWSSDRQAGQLQEGSPLFQAPEIVCGQAACRSAGFKVDVWSAGVCLYLMLFGRYPFADDSLLGLYEKILHEELQVPVADLECGSAVADLLARCLDKDQARRASSLEVLAHPWLKLVGCSAHPYSQQAQFAELAAHHIEESAGNRMRDLYRSMSVLPYLHGYHFPNSLVRVPEASCGGLLAPDEGSPSESGGSSTSGTSSSSSDSDGGQSDPHEMVSDSPIAWGTEEQYKRLKMPSIRANRTRSLASRFSRLRRACLSKMRAAEAKRNRDDTKDDTNKRDS